MEKEKLTFGPDELAQVLNYELSTLLRLMNDQPARLPPAVLLGECGKKGKRVWLRATVASWLKEREIAATAVKSQEPARQVQAPMGSVTKRGVGRPKKMSPRPRGGETSRNIEELIRGTLLKHLSSEKNGEGHEGVLGDLVISPLEGTMEWMPSATTTTRPDGSAA